MSLRATCLTILTIFLLVPGSASAGQFYITQLSSSEISQYSMSTLVGASTTARFQGTVDWDDDTWQISTSVRPAGGSWHDGTPNSGDSITANMIITCSYTNCGGSANVNNCTSSNANNAYTYKGAVAISHSVTGNQTDSEVDIGFLNCPNSGNDPVDPGALEDGCEPVP